MPRESSGGTFPTLGVELHTEGEPWLAGPSVPGLKVAVTRRLESQRYVGGGLPADAGWRFFGAALGAGHIAFQSGCGQPQSTTLARLLMRRVEAVRHRQRRLFPPDAALMRRFRTTVSGAFRAAPWRPYSH